MLQVQDFIIGNKYYQIIFLEAISSCCSFLRKYSPNTLVCITMVCLFFSLIWSIMKNLLVWNVV